MLLITDANVTQKINNVIYFHKIYREAMNLPKTSNLHTEIVIQD